MNFGDRVVSDVVVAWEVSRAHSSARYTSCTRKFVWDVKYTTGSDDRRRLPSLANTVQSPLRPCHAIHRCQALGGVHDVKKSRVGVAAHWCAIRAARHPGCRLKSGDLPVLLLLRCSFMGHELQRTCTHPRGP
jgi:hypothetical protein